MSNLPIPKAALAQHVIALGKTGSGKSSKLRVIVEHLLAGDTPVSIIDPKGDWWGLKSSADGKHSGFPLVIFGGEHADVPINEHSGAHVAELVATGNRSCIIDLGGWMVGERTRFFIAYASTLFKLARGARHQVIDEVHNFAPQGKIHDPDAGKMLHWANRLASEGRGKGITLIAASQRPQKVSKDFVTSCETLIACKVLHKLDRDAIKDWIDGCADPVLGRQVVGDLAQMKKPEAWVWSPEIEYGPKRVTWPLFTTYDSFKPQPADAGKLKGWASVDLDDVKEKLAKVVDEARANDPKALKARIVELERELKKPAASAGVPSGYSKEHLNEACDRADGEGYARGRVDGFKEGFETLANNSRVALLSMVDANDKVVAGMESILAQIKKAPKAPPIATVHMSPSAPPATRKALGEVVRHASRAMANVSTGTLPRAERALMSVLAQYPQGRSRTQLSLLSGYSSNSSSFANALGALRAAGYVERGDPVRVTEAGLQVAGEVEPLPTGEALRNYWLGRLDKAERSLLTCIFDAYPKEIERDELANVSGYSSGSSSFANALGKLRSLELVQRGPIRASESLFE